MSTHTRLGNFMLGATAFLFLLFAATARAQLTSGTITGTVQDQSSAAVPSASVTVKNVETGVARATVSGPTGRYEVPNLQPGAYEV